MEEYTLTPYAAFACIADKCRHSCCKGWEIDVDEESLAKWPEEYLAHISYAGDVPHFVLLEGDVCPFLTEKGLCRMILERGEDALCEICREHPRWHSFLPDRVETGLGLCCEEAARLTLSYPEKAQLLPAVEDCSPRSDAIARLQNRALPFSRRLTCAFESMDALQFLMTLERMDAAWTQLLENALSADYPDAPQVNPMTENAFEQFAVALTYRHGAEEGGTFFAEFSARVFMKLCAYWEYANGSLMLEDMVEICRLYSSEIEYSDENIAAILEQYALRGLHLPSCFPFEETIA